MIIKIIDGVEMYDVTIPTPMPCSYMQAVKRMYEQHLERMRTPYLKGVDFDVLFVSTKP